MDSLFAEVNHLPANDPLRSNNIPGVAPIVDKRVAEDKPLHETNAASPAAPQASVQAPASTSSPDAVTISAKPTVTVPSFTGESVREVIEKAEAAGLGVQVLGSGLAAEQVPAAGSKVTEGTQIVVRFHP